MQKRPKAEGCSLLQAHVINMGVSLIHNLLLEQLLNDVLNGDDAHWGGPLFPGKRCCAGNAALRCLQSMTVQLVSQK